MSKGWPFDANRDDIKDFFYPFDQDIEYIYFINNQSGRFSGNCYIVFNDVEDAR